MVSEKVEVILLSYQREGIETFTGHITGGRQEFHFTRVTFMKMFEMTGEALRYDPGLRLVIQRREAPNSVTLPPGMENLLRRDPVAAVAALSPPPQRVIVRDVTKPKLNKALRYGHDTLADSIGEEVYLKAKLDTHHPESWLQAEDPLTGRWVPILERDGKLYCGDLAVKYYFMGESRWIVARTEDILASDAARYYLPRRWNEGLLHGVTQGWISHDSFESIYRSYKKEKANVSK